METLAVVKFFVKLIVAVVKLIDFVKLVVVVVAKLIVVLKLVVVVVVVVVVEKLVVVLKLVVVEVVVDPMWFWGMSLKVVSDIQNVATVSPLHVVRGD